MKECLLFHHIMKTPNDMWTTIVWLLHRDKEGDAAKNSKLGGQLDADVVYLKINKLIIKEALVARKFLFDCLL